MNYEKQPPCVTNPGFDEINQLWKFAQSLKHAHNIDITVRQDGVETRIEGDFLKYLDRYIERAASIALATKKNPLAVLVGKKLSISGSLSVDKADEHIVDHTG